MNNQKKTLGETVFLFYDYFTFRPFFGSVHTIRDITPRHCRRAEYKMASINENINTDNFNGIFIFLNYLNPTKIITNQRIIHILVAKGDDEALSSL